MNQSHRATLAGLLIIASVIAGAAIIIASADGRADRGPVREFVGVFGPGSDLQGLDDLSSVRILGIEVGRVRGVRIQPQDNGQPQVQVRFTVPAQYPLYPGSRVTVQSQITGGARLNIESLGDASQPPLETGAVIEGHTLTLDDVMARIDGLVPVAEAGISSATATADSIRGLTGRVEGEVDAVMSRYHAVMGTAESALAATRDLLGDSSSDLRQTFENVRQLTSDAREQIPSALADGRALMQRARATLEKLDPILADGKAVSAEARSVLVDNRAHIDQTLANLRRASVQLKGGVAEIRRAPWRLLNKPDPKDQRNLDLYEAARRFADGAHDLQAAALSIQLAAADPNTDPERLDALREELAGEIASFVEVRQRLYDRFEK